MTDIELKRFGRPIDLNDRRKKILEYVANIYSKNFDGKTIPLFVNHSLSHLKVMMEEIGNE